MKIDRLIGILSILLQRSSVTAPELAERFEVSRRTINRDVEALCQAGIPIVTRQGAGGGISIMEGYRMDRTLLSVADMQAILAGRSLIPDLPEAPPYPGAKDYFLIENVDDRDFLTALTLTTCQALPEAKKGGNNNGL